ncbi:DUF488 domain-containing protein [Phenylobacterium sp.]|jgi:uncharacterized protein (DUF488 family)|uniref:DUF488 domain-containing protein n=1 Tax=Phenylobacterium sp. TaxID=1871053 RepID=UPI002F94C2B0
MKPVATVGYQAETQPAVIERLKQAGVEVVIDVRAVAASRRAGFSKTLLASSLKEAGIDYVHLRDLGTPKPGRIAARAGRIGEMKQIFEDHLAEPGAQLQLAQAAEMARERKVALLCYEADPKGCHRAIVADRICEQLGCRIEHL